jgi:hypothetical protein
MEEMRRDKKMSETSMSSEAKMVFTAWLLSNTNVLHNFARRCKYSFTPIAAASR